MTVDWVTGVIDYSNGFLVKATENGLKYVVAFVGALCVSLVLTPLCREAAKKLGMIDQPSERRINKTPVPRGGGLAVFVAFHVVLFSLFFVTGGAVDTSFSGFLQGRFLMASSLLVVIGLIDDKFGLKALVKLVGQIGVASLLFFSGVHMGGVVVAFPTWLDYMATVFWIVGAINAFNLIDGMDGLATGLALIACVGLAGALVFTGNSSAALPYLVLAGACLGFLRYNFHPASVFLGDTGSMFLGLCLATIPLMTGSRKELVASLGVPMLAMGVPIFDTLLAIWRRTVRNFLPQSVVSAKTNFCVMQPDKDHIHHRILRKTLNQRTAALILYSISAGLVMLGVFGTLFKNRAPGLFMIAFIVAVIVIVRHLDRVELWDTGRLFSRERVRIRQAVVMPLYMLFDVVSLGVVWLLARVALDLPLGRASVLTLLPMFVVPQFIFLVLFKTYLRVWSRAQMRDFALLMVALLAGTGMGVGLFFLFGEDDPSLLRFAFVFGTLSVFPIVGIRLVHDSIQGIMQVLEKRVLLEKAGISRILVYGAGVRFRSYMRERAVRVGHNDQVILGVIDDDLHLRGRIVAGYEVLGVLSQLGELVTKWKIDALVITCDLKSEKMERIVRMAESLGLLVSVWVCEERSLGAEEGETHEKVS